MRKGVEEERESSKGETYTKKQKERVHLFWSGYLWHMSQYSKYQSRHGYNP